MFHGYDMIETSPKGSGNDDKKTTLVTLSVDEPFFRLLDLQWKINPAGRSIYSVDHQVVINEAAIGKLNLPSNPIGEELAVNDKYAVAGVVRNFVFNSLHGQIEPVCLFVQKDTSTTWGVGVNGSLFARIRPGVNLPSLLASIKKVYERYDPNTPFEYEFMDDAFNARYKAEDRLAGILDVFTGLTILIACLGLFGLAAFSASQKFREIGIRKVLGASVQSLVLLQTRSFIQWVLLGIVLAVPVSWYLMSKWLENFAYKIHIGWSVFALSALMAILIAMITVSFESVRSALANPVRALRTE
jgi:putative ABC transport system permease protein